VVGEHLGTATALMLSAAGMIVGLATTFRIHLRSGEGLNLAPSRQWPAPIVNHDLEPDRGPVLVTVRYRVDPGRTVEFTTAMDGVRRIRLRDGAMQWGLFVDAVDPELHTEIFLVKSWIEYLRQRERFTHEDRDVQERARGFHTGPEPPVVQRLIADPVRRG